MCLYVNTLNMKNATLLFCLIYLNINQLDALNFIMSLFHASTCFEHMCSLPGGQNCNIQPLVLSHLQVAVLCREIDHAPAPSAQVKNGWSYTSSLPIRLHGVGRDNITSYTFLCKPMPKNVSFHYTVQLCTSGSNHECFPLLLEPMK